MINPTLHTVIPPGVQRHANQFLFVPCVYHPALRYPPAGYALVRICSIARSHEFANKVGQFLSLVLHNYGNSIICDPLISLCETTKQHG